MGTPLDSTAALEIRERFSYFFDGLVDRVELDRLSDRREQRRAVVRVLAAESPSEDWYSITFELEGLRAFKLGEGRTSHIVLSDGLGIHHLPEGVFLDLAPFVDLYPFTSADVNPDLVWRSHQYLVGSSCTYRVEPLGPDTTPAA